MNNEKYYDFLDRLRETGHTNMFGSGPYLQEAYGLTKYEARDVVLAWMQTFSERKVKNA